MYQLNVVYMYVKVKCICPISYTYMQLYEDPKFSIS